MNALHVFLIGSLPVNIVFDDDGHVFMADGTRQWNVLSIDLGLKVRDVPDVVLAVAVPAPGDLLIASLQIGLPVDAVGIGKRTFAGSKFSIFAVALQSATDVGQGFGMRQVFFFARGKKHMTVGTLQGRVDGGFKGRFVDLEVLISPGLGFIAVTDHAAGVSGSKGCRLLKSEKGRLQPEAEADEKGNS